MHPCHIFHISGSLLSCTDPIYHNIFEIHVLIFAELSKGLTKINCHKPALPPPKRKFSRMEKHWLNIGTLDTSTAKHTTPQPCRVLEKVVTSRQNFQTSVTQFQVPFHTKQGNASHVTTTEVVGGNVTRVT